MTPDTLEHILESGTNGILFNDGGRRLGLSAEASVISRSLFCLKTINKAEPEIVPAEEVEELADAQGAVDLDDFLDDSMTDREFLATWKGFLTA